MSAMIPTWCAHVSRWVDFLHLGDLLTPLRDHSPDPATTGRGSPHTAASWDLTSSPPQCQGWSARSWQQSLRPSHAGPPITPRNLGGPLRPRRDRCYRSATCPGAHGPQLPRHRGRLPRSPPPHSSQLPHRHPREGLIALTGRIVSGGITVPARPQPQEQEPRPTAPVCLDSLVVLFSLHWQRGLDSGPEAETFPGPSQPPAPNPSPPVQKE